jgi:hypothetical protein
LAKKAIIEALTQKINTTGTVNVTVNVPEDCSLYEAIGMKNKYARKYFTDGRSVTIVLGKGKHQLDDDIDTEIDSAMNIVGDPGVKKEEIVIRGALSFNKGIEGNCHLQHLTLRGITDGNDLDGVNFFSSFTMEDVVVEQYNGNGVWAEGTGVLGRCTNVEVRQCGYSGVVAGSGASITLIGAKTTVHHNCTYYSEYNRQRHGLEVVDSDSTIQLVSPLTKEQVSVDNDEFGGGNWAAGYGADINQIKTIIE